jgi:hypothetical protein
LGGKGEVGRERGFSLTPTRSRVDELRTTVQEGDFQVSIKGNLICKWNGKKGKRKGGRKKGSQGGSCACASLVYMLIKDCV